MGLFWEQ